MAAFVARVAAFAVVFLIVAEVWFRTVVPASHLPYQIQDPEFMVLRLAGAPEVTGRTTTGRLGRHPARWHVNEAGWNSTVEYLPADQRTRPCVAVIGNSFVEGTLVDVDAGVTAVLARELDGAWDVYNFGKAAVCAAQMIRVARYADHHHAPEAYVFVLTYGSLRESIRDYHPLPYNHQYTWSDGALVDVPPERYLPSPLRRLRIWSALGRYLYLNAGGIQRSWVVRQEAVQRRGPEEEERARREWPVLGPATRRIVATVRADHPHARILFVLDADRQLMAVTSARPEPLRDSALWAAACREHGCDFLDLTEDFWTAYSREPLPFEHPGNYHWNSRGAAVVARAIARWLETTPG